jgi:hypothetical protein
MTGVRAPPNSRIELWTLCAPKGCSSSLLLPRLLDLGSKSAGFFFLFIFPIGPRRGRKLLGGKHYRPLKRPKRACFRFVVMGMGTRQTFAHAQEMPFSLQGSKAEAELLTAAADLLGGDHEQLQALLRPSLAHNLMVLRQRWVDWLISERAQLLATYHETAAAASSSAAAANPGAGAGGPS